MFLPGLGVFVRRQASRLWQRGHRQAAIRLATWLVRISDYLIHDKQYGRDEAILQGALERHPGTGELRYQMARVLAEQSRQEEASRILEAQRQADPDSLFPYLGLADLAAARRDCEEAMKQAAMARPRIPSTYPWAKLHLATDLFFCLEARQDVKSLLSEAIDSLPTSHPMAAGSHFLLGALLEHDGMPEAADNLKFARRHWNRASDFEEHLQQTRRLLAKADATKATKAPPADLT